MDTAVKRALVVALGGLGARRVLGIGARVSDCVRSVVQAGFEITLLDEGLENLARVRNVCGVDALCGESVRLPLRTASWDAAIVAGVPVESRCLDAFFHELRRVVCKGAAIEAVTRENFETLWIRHYFPELASTLAPFRPALGAIITAALRAGFGTADAKPILYSCGGAFLLKGAQTRPELLFDERFRAGLPEFAALNPGAIDCGLRNLRRDLYSGRFEQVRAGFEAERVTVGDSFVVTLKAA